MRNFRTLWLALGCFIVIASCGLTGCGTKDQGTVIKISSWGDLQENVILVNLISEFEKLHPDIHVKLERIPFSQYVPKLLTEVVGGIAPDVIFVEVNNFTDLYLRGALEPLTPFIQRDNFPLNDYYPAVVDRFTSNGNTYVIPRDTAPIAVIYYNKQAFDEAHVPYPTDDWDWNEFVSDAKKVMKYDPKDPQRVTRWGFIDEWPIWDAWVYDAGGSFADDVKKPTQWTFATDPASLVGIQFRSDLMNKYKIMPQPAGLAAMGGVGTADMFENGSAAMYFSGLWKVPQFRQITDFKWDVVMFPKNPSGFRGFPTGGSGYGILKSSKHKEAAWELIKYISGPEGARALASTGLAQPAIMDVANSPLFLDGKVPLNKRMVLDAMKYVKYNPMCKNWFEVHDSIIGPELDRVWNGTESPKEAMDKLRPELAQNPPQTDN
ncbi:MAG TPA: sugar ABC transporter substrate-binding protein [bacterium]|nr:sugar ABC transporter substrate-binding protein [bacterium]